MTTELWAIFNSDDEIMIAAPTLPVAWAGIVWALGDYLEKPSQLNEKVGEMMMELDYTCKQVEVKVKEE